MRPKVKDMPHLNELKTDWAKKILRFAKDWALPLSMLTGAAAYYAYVAIPGHERFTPMANKIISIVQPGMLFLMLFVTFCKMPLSDLRLRRWHLPLALFQSLLFAALTLLAVVLVEGDAKIVVESAMLCLICPTATAAVVITTRLGGNAPSVAAYTIVSNLCAALLIPLLLPLCHHGGMGFIASLQAILYRVFPLLLCPLALATIVRRFFPRLLSLILNRPNLAFYLWVVSLSLAITVSVKSFEHTDAGAPCLLGIAAASLVCCLAQFAFGRRCGQKAGDTIAAGQALGQKNTVFIIWVGYTFLTPVTALAGGFYSIWHNAINSWQLYQARRKAE